MKKLNPPAPFYSAPEDEKWAFFWYWVDQCLAEHRYDEQLVSHMFKEGKIYQIIQISFDDFKTRVLRKHKNLREGRRYYRSSFSWYSYHGVDFREPLAYVRRDHHVKKELSEKEVSRRDWRESKGFNRDRRRPHWTSRRTYAKHISNRMHRAHTKACLQKERYDDLTSFLDKNFKDKWLFD